MGMREGIREGMREGMLAGPAAADQGFVATSELAPESGGMGLRDPPSTPPPSPCRGTRPNVSGAHGPHFITLSG